MSMVAITLHFGGKVGLNFKCQQDLRYLECRVNGWREESLKIARNFISVKTNVISYECKLSKKLVHQSFKGASEYCVVMKTRFSNPSFCMWSVVKSPPPPFPCVTR